MTRREALRAAVRTGIRAGARSGLRLALIDVALPLLVLGALLTQIIPYFTMYLDDWAVILAEISPSDGNGTLWFWWWVHTALTQGRDLLQPDVVCAPGVDPLGTNFPNRIDALFAFPFLHFLKPPVSLNLAILSMIFAAAWTGFLFLRMEGRRWPVALAGGLLFGANVYSFSEIEGGRPVTALVAELPLFLAALRQIGRSPRPWIWGLAAGAVAALTVHHYIPFALFLGLIGLPIGLLCLWRPAASRLRVLGAAGLMLVSALWLSLPYFHEVLVVRKAGPASALATWTPRAPAAIWEARFYQDLYDLSAQFRQRPPPGRPFREAISMVQGESMPWFYLWHVAPGEVGHRTFIPRTTLAAGLLLCLLGGRAGIGWLVAAFGVYLITLGPYASEVVQVGYARTLKLGGGDVALPLAWLLRWAPSVEAFLRPYRAFPLLVLCLAAGGTAGIDRVAGWIGRRIRGAEAPETNASTVATNIVADTTNTVTDTTNIVTDTTNMNPMPTDAPPAPAPAPTRLTLLRQRIGPVAAWLVALLLAGGWVGEAVSTIRGGGWYRLPLYHWQFSPFLLDLGERPGTAGLIELPAGLGHATSILQIVHQQDRSDLHHDALHRLRNDMPPPDNCFQLPLLRAAWYIGQQTPAALAAQEAGFTPAAVAEARAAGFRYFVLYPEGFRLLRHEKIQRSQAAMEAALTARFGAAIFEDAQIKVWELK